MEFATDLIRIAAAGGGLRIDASKYFTTDLIRIAAAASNHRSLLILDNSENIFTSDKNGDDIYDDDTFVSIKNNV